MGASASTFSLNDWRMRLHASPTLFALIRRKWLLLTAPAGLLLVVAVLLFRACGQRDERAFRLSGPVPIDSAGFSDALWQSLGARMEPGHQVSLLQNGEVFDALVAQIGQAKKSVHILMYIWEQGAASDRVVDALVSRARAGVACRIVVDDLGSPDFAKTVKPRLAAGGCEARTFRPLPAGRKLARNHRKLVVVDGAAAITGGFGIRDNWLGNGSDAKHWRDTSVLFSGPSVTDAQRAFTENWQEAGGALLMGEIFPEPSRAGSSSAAFIASTAAVVTRAERLLQLTMAAAQHRIWIENAYFVPSPGILELLKRKARAGIDVRIISPDKNSDSKTAFGAQHIEYGDLIDAGVRIWEYTASMLHAKTMLVDDDLALVSSINLDPLSLYELEETALLFRDSGLVRDLASSFTADTARSRAVEH